MDDTGETKFSSTRRRVKPGTLALIVLFHVVMLYGIAKAFAPGFTASVEREVLSTFTVTITAPPDPPKENEPQPDEGAAGEQGKQAVPKPVTAEKPKIKLKQDKPVPRASSTGAADSSGAKASGEGTGASGSGNGTGSGNGGGGQGGVPVTKPVKIAGDINSARDFPVPAGGRQARFGNQVVVYMTVGTDGRASNCRVTKPSGDAEADRIVCQLAVERFRFKPAMDANGNPVASTYGWQQRWFDAGN
ncbi:MAG: TonB family protein [Sphingomonadales bacterium]|nr:TonB family protein [Sphingomonadales bacterium]MBD3771996.1 TonB family protein [Paracoccaceae bacterium]MBD3813853.1 TonB family protein [Betaproteobacteria bacterium]